MSNPTSEVFMNASGDKAWYGWPKNEDYEALRANWVNMETLGQRKELASQMQKIWWDFVGDVRLGQELRPIARRKALTDLIEMPVPIIAMWNMRKV